MSEQPAHARDGGEQPVSYGGGPLSALGMALVIIGTVVAVAGFLLGEMAQAGGQPPASALTLLNSVAWGGIAIGALGSVFVALEVAAAAAVVRIADRLGGSTEDDPDAE